MMQPDISSNPTQTMESTAVQPSQAPQPVVSSSPGVMGDTTVQPAVGGAFQPVLTAGQPPAFVQAAQPDVGVVPKKGHGALRVLSIVAALIVVFGLGYFASSKVTAMVQTNATKQARTFIADLNKNDKAGAYAMTSDSLRKQQTESQFSDAMGDLSNSKPKLSGEITSYNGNQATYKVVEDGLPPTDSGSTVGSFTILLVKDGMLGWKIQNASVQ